MAKKSLNPKQLTFIAEYVQCMNASEAARRAGYTGQANVVGPRLLANVSIVAALETEFSKRIMSANEVLMHLSDIARANLDDFTDDSTGALDIPKAKRLGKMHLVSKIKDRHFIDAKNDTETHEIELETYSRLEALKTLAKYHDLITTKTLKIEDWRSLAIEHIKAGRISYDVLAEEFDPDLATELFMLAGVPVT